MTGRRSLWGLAAAFALQVALLGGMVGDRALLLARGKEIRLKVVPIDPRDLFRGDYVTLSFPLSRVEAAKLDGDDEFALGDPIFVSLRSTAGGWQPVALNRVRPDGEIVLRGKVQEEHGDCEPACRVYLVDYGLERFFVPEGQGRALELLRNDQRVEVDVAVASSGRAALKRLLVDGEVRYAEDAVLAGRIQRR